MMQDDDQRKTLREVIAGAAVEAHAIALLVRDDTEAIVRDFVQPITSHATRRSDAGKPGDCD